MRSRFAATSLAVALLAAPFAVASPARAQDTTVEAGYASVLRTINPQLQVHESLAFARSLLASSQRTNLDPNLIMALVTVESSWRPAAVSYHGAQGLAQLMPATAAGLHVNPRNPAENLRGASKYLRSLVDRFADRGINALRDAIGAYNAGPVAVENAHGLPRNPATRRYVQKVIAQWHALSARLAKVLVSGSGTAEIGADEKMWLSGAGASALAVSASSVSDSLPATRSLPVTAQLTQQP